MIKSLELKNFLSFKDVYVRFKEFNVILGANGCGKTNLINGITTFEHLIGGEMTNLDLFTEKKIRKHSLEDEALVYEIEFDNSITFFDKIDNQPTTLTHHNYYLELQLEQGVCKEYFYSETDDDQKSYNLLARDKNSGHIMFSENYCFDDLKKMELRNSISSTPPMINNAVSNIIESILKKTFTIFVYKLQSEKIITPSSYRNQRFVDTEGENTSGVLQYFKVNKPEVIEIINTILRRNISVFDHLDIKELSPNKCLFVVIEKDGQEYMFDELSDGTRIFIALVTILITLRYTQYQNEDRQAIVIIEEAEKKLDPHLMEEIIGLTKSLTPQYQVIMTTHSADLVKHIDPDDLILLDKTIDGTRVQRVENKEEVDEFLKDYNLDQLVSSNALGCAAV